jgi:hypothetical protein
VGAPNVIRKTGDLRMNQSRAIALAATKDNGRIRLGGAWRLPVTKSTR